MCSEVIGLLTARGRLDAVLLGQTSLSGPRAGKPFRARQLIGHVHSGGP